MQFRWDSELDGNLKLFLSAPWQLYKASGGLKQHVFYRALWYSFRIELQFGLLASFLAYFQW